jgi:iron(III) transport system permease protein
LLQLAAAGKGSSTQPVWASRLETWAGELDPYRNPGLLLFVAVSLVFLWPRLRWWHELSSSENHPGHGWEAARIAGARPGQARKLASRPKWRFLFGQFLLSAALAAANLAPALLFAPTLEGRPLAPGVLILAQQPDDARNQAAVLATCAIAVNLTALALAWGTRGASRPLHEWDI